MGCLKYIFKAKQCEFLFGIKLFCKTLLESLFLLIIIILLNCMALSYTVNNVLFTEIYTKACKNTLVWGKINSGNQ